VLSQRVWHLPQTYLSAYPSAYSAAYPIPHPQRIWVR